MNPELNPFFEKPEKKPTSKVSIVLTLLSACSILFLVSWFTIFGQNQVDGPSMQPNYYTGEFLFVNRIPQILDTGYSRGEVIIYKKPNYPEFVKRVIALPGDKVSIKNCFIYVNGKKMVEQYLASGLCTNAGTFIQEGAPEIEVPQGYYFTVGDNRPKSLDSRFVELGFTKKEWIKGSVFLRIWPLDTFGFIGLGDYEFE